MWISNTSVRRPVFATMVISALIVFGFISLGNLPLTEMPEIDFPIVTIRSILPGADPQTVETEVSDKIEEVVNTIDGIDQVSSTSLEGISIVVIEFDLEKDVDIAVQDVRDKLASIRRDLPDQLEEPIVEKLDIGSIPVLTLVVSGTGTGGRSESELIRYVTEYTKNNIKERLQTITGVGNVTMIGGQEREIRIWLDADKMRGYSIPVDLVEQVLQNENVEVPGGRIETRDTETVVKTYGKLESIQEFNDLIISYSEGRPVRLRDIGYAEDGMEDLRSIAYLEDERAVALEVRKVSGGNVVAVADRVKAELENIKNILPDDIQVRIAIDNSTYVRAAIGDVRDAMVIGGTLAVFVILFFLRNFRTAIIAAIVLPTAVLSSMSFVNAFGFSLNQLTMLALTISIGMLIDDAVVVIESVYHKLEHGEIDPKQAAIDAIKEIGLAVVTTSATILGVFIPVAFMTGIIGRFFYEFGLTVAFAVVLSTFTSLTLTPMLCSRFLKPRPKEHNIVHRIITRFLRSLDTGYRWTLGKALRHRFITVVLAVGVFIFGMYLAGLVPGEFTPPEDQGQFSVNIEAPLGSSVYQTRDYTFQVAEVVRQVPGVQFVYFSVGGGAEEQVHIASMMVKMIPLAERAFTQSDMMAAVRDKLAGRFENLDISVAELQQIGGGAFSSYQVNYSIRGSNLDQLEQIAEDLLERLRRHGGFVDLNTSYQEGKPELSLRIDRDKAADLGVTVGNVAFAVNALVGGQDVTTFESGGEQYDVRVRLVSTDRDEDTDLNRLLVSTMSGGTVELNNVVTLTEGTGPVQIDRLKRMREVSVQANLDPSFTLGEAVTVIDETVQQMDIPPGIVTEHIGMTEVMQESFESMIFSLFLAIVIIYMVLASLFESFIHPFTIMMSLPLSVSGAIGALLIAGQTLNILAMIGIIMLMGLVTKNAILLIDYTIQLRNQGKSRLDALLEAGPRRLRPILMTSISTIAGSIPVAMGLGEGGAFRSSMGVAVIGGMVTSTLLTLLVVPVVYSLMDDLAQFRLPGWIAFWRKKDRSRPAEAD